MPAVVKSVEKDSIADEIGIEQGDEIVSIDGKPLCDILEYKYYTASFEFELEYKKPDGSSYIVDIINEDYEDLGIEFENPMIDNTRSCRNKCVFCFIDQLPPNMRETMYVKDDDYRLSAFLGNYITLTNVTDEEIDKIIDMKLPRINISVHTTNPDLRCRMLNNRFAGNINERMKKLADAGIKLNAQIVLCPEYNDGSELDKTISDLAELSPAMTSISVVPVGLSRFREGLADLRLFTVDEMKDVICQIEHWQYHLSKKYNNPMVYASDEFYVRSGTPIPSYDKYGDFLQLENGVGMVALLRREFFDAVKDEKLPAKTTDKSVVTGTLAGELIAELCNMVDDEIRVYPITNDFFGENITVAGLVTGQDIINQLKGKPLGEILILPDVMLRDECFLDNTTISDVEKALDIKIKVVPTDGYSLFDALKI